MKPLTKTFDERIKASNFLIELSIGEYINLADKALQNNEYQRRRVKSASSVYALLKEDLQKGCLIPPIVLGLPIQPQEGGDTLDNICETLTENAEKLLILDGLQRTYTIIDLKNELESKQDENALKSLLGRTLRVEAYIGINRIGILYRMLTLNTGQTPMSLRQQIEMLYIDFSKIPIPNVKIIKESDDDAPQALGEYTFRSIIDGFNAYLERNELPFDRFDILENIKGLEKLSQENQDVKLFEELVSTYDSFVRKISELTNSKTFSSEELGISGQAFGKDARRIFTKSQAITGFGSAIGKLKDFNAISGYPDIVKSIPLIKNDGNSIHSVGKLLKILEKIRLTSKKIGNSQRLYFHFFFRELFNPQGDSHLNIEAAADNAFQKYQVQVG
jgi:hypothetical protein